MIHAANEVVEVNAPFVGRDLEMRRLRTVFDASVTDHLARLVTVVGSPGLGKTRLSRELCAEITSDANALTFEIRCDRAGNATFAPIAQMMTSSGLNRCCSICWKCRPVSTPGSPRFYRVL